RGWLFGSAIFEQAAGRYRRYELPLMARLWADWPPPPDAAVAEVGCGYGVMMRVMREAGLRPRGSDLSARAVAVCRSQGLDVVEGKSPGVPLPAAKLALPLPPPVL